MTTTMSQTSTSHVDSEEPTPDDPLEAVAENRDLLERIANSDVPLSGVCQRALDELDADAAGDTEGEIDD